MKKNKSQANVPALRFPEFLGSGAWELNALKDVAKYRRGSFPQPYGLPEWYDDENGFPFIQVVDVGNNLKLKEKTKRQISSLAAENSVFIEKGTLIITIQGSIGRVAITEYDAYIDRTLLLFQDYLLPTNKLFFAYILETLFSIEKNKAPGGIIKTITKEALSNFLVLMPNIQEQQKIANCLSSLDEWITAESKQLTALKTHKTGLMQQLFPSEGETTPKLRFPEFQNDGAWEKSTIGDISFISSGGTPNRQNQSYWGGDIPWITTTLIDFNYIDKAIEYITQKGLENSSARKIKENTILMAMYGQGKTRGKVAILSITAATNQACAAIQVKSNHNVNFVFQNLMSRYEEIRKISNEGGQKNLSATIIKTIPFKYPPKEEQQKIADCLSSLDTLITAQTKKIEQLKQHKKGLMQQLFPTLDGVGA